MFPLLELIFALVMASPFILKSLIFCQLLVLVIIVSAEADQDGKCPSSFKCGNLGDIQFPFTDTQHPKCGVLAIHGCQDQTPAANKSIQLSNTPIGRLNVAYVEYNTITINDEIQQKYLRDRNCKAFSNNFTLPPASPLGSVQIKFNRTLFRCNKSLSVTLPPNFYNYKNCSDYNIYYGPSNMGSHPWPRSLTTCSKVQLAIKDNTDTDDPFSFLSHAMQLEVQLSDDCRKCIDHQRGHCQLDGQGKFSCITDKNWAWKLGVGIGLPGIIIIGLLLFIWFWKRRRGPDFISNPQPESGTVYFGVPVFSYKDLEVATKKFDHSRELGDGGFGTVYYGKLKDGREVAVKRLYEHNYRRVQQFMNEVQILTRLRHRNLVPLYGCTSRHSRELLLVYEYLSNSTIASHLHGELARTANLPWHTRIKIAIETATALAYLHASDIIHRDVKTNNILLDNNFTVKVADFGLSRLFPKDVTHVSTAPQGTPGYVDPEYHQCYQLTSKSDVYSFGVVLIELISSKPAVDMTRDKDEISLANLALKKIKRGEIGDLVDGSLGFESESDVRREIVWVAELAFNCLQSDRELRPSMDEVLKALRRIESGNADNGGSVEEVEVDDGDEGMILSHGGDVNSPSPASPDHDEVKLLKNMKATPSPKAVTDKWKSECTTPNASAQSPIQSNVAFKSY